ncbi:MAG: hypothetical protein KC713_04420 [Candidatus Omnitrophica bacterium]|nr:hypothetical protein [Candidatus Omnitrophota bacterium]
MKIRIWTIYIGVCVLFGVFFPGLGEAQQTDQEVVNQRLDQLENFAQQIPQSMDDFSQTIQANIMEYLQQLEGDMKHFSAAMQDDINYQLQFLTYRKVQVNPFSKSFQRIESNAGTFFILVDKVQPLTDGGIRMTVLIGNPYFADFNGFTLNLFWGRPWDPNKNISFNEWRDSLKGAGVTFTEKIKKGIWNSFDIDVPDVEMADLKYLEVELLINSVELQNLSQN